MRSAIFVPSTPKKFFFFQKSFNFKPLQRLLCKQSPCGHSFSNITILRQLFRQLLLHLYTHNIPLRPLFLALLPISLPSTRCWQRDRLAPHLCHVNSSHVATVFQYLEYCDSCYFIYTPITYLSAHWLAWPAISLPLPMCLHFPSKTMVVERQVSSPSLSCKLSLCGHSFPIF